MSGSDRTVPNNVDALTAFTWSPQPRAAKLVHRLLNECLERCPFAACLAQRMRDETGTRMLDWIDHVGVADSDGVIPELAEAGYVESDAVNREVEWTHSEGMFPRIRQLQGKNRQLAIKVDSVVDFLFAHNLTDVSIQGAAQSTLRKACVSRGEGVEFWVVERHGTRQYETSSTRLASTDLAAIAHQAEVLRLRRRAFETDEEGFDHANTLIDSSISDLGRDRACDLFFAAERAYWQRRNRAGQIQIARQQKLGLGWANHDHHTYRSSRATFVLLIAFLEKLGFLCRERFYAGREAGWGAQVIEHPITGVTIFADVDMSPEELTHDFSHEAMVPREELGTVGLWCALHGEAFLQAGMHHLECQFDFAATRDQLKEAGIDTMPPFTDLPYLKQAFTRGEQWPVDPKCVNRLLKSKQITEPQAKQFLEQGALGSHLEILQRDDGYKGFNQRGINEIISATDPRHGH